MIKSTWLKSTSLRFWVVVFGSLLFVTFGCLEIAGIVVREAPVHYAPGLVFVEQHDGWLKILMGLCLGVGALGVFNRNRMANQAEKDGAD